MKDVLIGSVFANDLGLQPKWLELQLKFINETTKNFDHVAFVAGGITSDIFSQKTEVIVPSDTSLEDSDAHLCGLKSLLNHFKERASDYSHFLFLDGDAFPIKKNWFHDLKAILDPVSQTGMTLPNKKAGDNNK